MISFLDRTEGILEKWSYQLAISFILVAIILAPALLGQKVFGKDAVEHFIPQLGFYKDAFAGGTSLFWNPNIAVGFPNFINVVHPFTPTVILAILVSPATAHYLAVFVLLSLTLFFCILFLREIGINVWGSIIGGLSYLVAAIWHIQSAFVVTGILSQAVLFWVVIKIFYNKSPRLFLPYIVIGATGIAYNWLSIGYWQNLYTFFTIAAFSVYLLIRNSSDKKTYLRVAIGFFASWCLGTVIGLLQIIPTYVIAQYSVRSGGLSFEAAQGYAVSFKELLHFFYLSPIRGPDAYLYIGIVPLIFFIFSFYKKNIFKDFFLALFFIVLAISMKWSPIFWLLNKLPLFSGFEGAARFMFIGAFAGAVLVGLGSENLLGWLGSVSWASIKKRITVVAGCLIIVLAISAAVFSDRDSIYSILVSASLLLLTYLAFRFLWGKKILIFILTLIMAIDFVLVFYRFYLPISIDRSSYEKIPITLDFFKTNPGTFLPVLADSFSDEYTRQVLRGSELGKGPDYLFNLARETYSPNLQLLYPIANLEVQTPLLNYNMGRLMSLLGTRKLAIEAGEEKLNKIVFSTNFDGEGSNVAKRLEIFRQRLPLVDFLGIKYLLSAYNLSGWSSSLQVKEQFKIFPAGSEAPGFSLSVYENKNAKPLAYFARISGFGMDDTSVYKKFKDSNWSGIFVDCLECVDGPLVEDGRVSIRANLGGLVEVETRSSGDGFLVFSQNNLPGWRAFIDSQEVILYKVNTVFMGIFVPPGQHKIKFVYDYWSLFNPKNYF